MVGREETRDVAAHHQADLRGELEVDTATCLWIGSRACEVMVEARIHRRVRLCRRLALVLVIAEEMDPVFADGTAERRAELLIRVRQHTIDNEVAGVEPVAPKISRRRSRERVRSRFRDRVDLDACRATLARVDAIRHELELGDRITGVTRLTEA